MSTDVPSKPVARYVFVSNESPHLRERLDGPWVRFSDIEHLLEPPSIETSNHGSGNVEAFDHSEQLYDDRGEPHGRMAFRCVRFSDYRALQARFDAVMLEYCPDEMTAEQLNEWTRHQRPCARSETNTAAVAGPKPINDGTPSEQSIKGEPAKSRVTTEAGLAESRKTAPLQQEPRALELPPLDDSMRQILGRPNFACAQLAGWLREKGHEIKGRSEDEQAAVLHWTLGLYLQHGEKWPEAAEAYLKANPTPQNGNESDE